MTPLKIITCKPEEDVNDHDLQGLRPPGIDMA